MDQRKINIAIDGYSSCGKGTLAKAMALALSYVFIDSGAMYRAVTLFLMRKSVNLDDMAQVEQALAQVTVEFDVNDAGASVVLLNGENVEDEIRTIAVASKVSEVAKIQAVRDKLVFLQQQMGVKKGVVMDGRDIGTVVFPDAELKIFMTASVEVRAQRRFAELVAKGDAVTLEEISANLKHRDAVDSSRENSPLTMTSDYRVLDNSEMDRDSQFALAMAWADEVFSLIS
ncbi:MAG: (d)CMP kinase [Bacteroidetes bacterium]|nr:(d)CMP kinase [Bacteroidota bacterium]MDA1223651.1 (d)CMP kinase [Bacteroidota bacterium]